MPAGSKPGERRGGRKKGSKNKAATKKTQAEVIGKAVLLAATDQVTIAADEMELPVPFALRMLNTPIPEDAPLVAKIAALDFKGKMAALAAPYCHFRKGEEREPPPPPPAKTGDAKEITYDAARRVLFALAVLERAEN